MCVVQLHNALIAHFFFSPFLSFISFVFLYSSSFTSSLAATGTDDDPGAGRERERDSSLLTNDTFLRRHKLRVHKEFASTEGEGGGREEKIHDNNDDEQVMGMVMTMVVGHVHHHYYDYLPT